MGSGAAIPVGLILAFRPNVDVACAGISAVQTLDADGVVILSLAFPGGFQGELGELLGSGSPLQSISI